MTRSAAWDKEWINRTVKGGITRNKSKASYLCRQLWDRPYLIPMMKLEVGCGECAHIRALSKYCQEWKRNYIGIDISEYIVDIAVKNGIDAYVDDIFTMADTGIGFNLFLFLDVLEHLDDWSRVAAKVKSLAADDLVIIGNVPMAPGPGRDEEIKDRPISTKNIADFADACGCDTMDYEIYDSFGFPFLFFEATNYKGDK